ncbi:MAG: DUF1330 domain-containing protein [Planctomycetota bacterium]
MSGDIRLIVVLNLFDIIPGREAQYAEYLRRVQPILDRHGAKVLVYGLARAIHMGDCAQEYCGIIGYPSVRELKALSHDEEFCCIRPLRDNSTTNYVLTTIEDFETLNHAATYLDARAIQEQRENPAATPGE